MKKEKIFWGLFLIAAAILIVITKLGMFPDISIVTLLLTVFFVAAVIKSLIHLEFTGVFFSLAFLGIIYDDPLGITAITPWTILGVALLLSIGVGMIYHPKRQWEKNAERIKGEHYQTVDKDFKVYDEPDGSQFRFSSNFSGSIKYVNTDNFEYGDIDANFAGMKVYFDNAVIQNGSATLNVDVSFAGLEIFLPRNWHVENRIHASLGGVEEKNKPQPGDGPTLILTGNVNLGGLTIWYN